jgi:tRNA (guanine-N7-)-methyltransferase
MAYEEHIQRVEQRKAALKMELEAGLKGVHPIVLEIGCGHGHWLTEYAEQHSSQFCVGIDVIGDRIDRSNRKASRAGLSNIRFIKVEAGEFLELLPEGVLIDSVFILFPDPWPKKRHWKNRIMNSNFLDSLAKRCAENARLHFRTDHEGYFEWSEEMLPSIDSWRLTTEAEWPFERETVFQAKADSYQSMTLEKA